MTRNSADEKREIEMATNYNLTMARIKLLKAEPRPAGEGPEEIQEAKRHIAEALLARGRDLPEVVPCPVCGVGPDGLCLDENGEPQNPFHRERGELAREQYDGYTNLAEEGKSANKEAGACE